MLRTLIIGANSFIGQNLEKALRKNCLIFRTVYRSMLHSYNSFRMDISKKSSVKKVLKRYDPDLVINTSHYGGFRHQTNFKEMNNVNVLGVKNLVDCLPQNKFLIHFGTSSEYGIKEEAMSEKDNLDPVGQYAITKAVGSLIAASRKNTIVLRPFSPFGTHEQYTRLIPYLITCMKANKNIYLNTPNKVHDFFHVDYICDIVKNIIFNKSTVFSLNRNIFNIGSGNGHTVATVANILKDIIGHKGLIEYNNDDDIHYPNWIADTTLTEKYLLPYESTIENDLRKAVSCIS